MASKLQLATSANNSAVVIDPVAVDQVVLIPLAMIDASHRLREVNEAYAEVMAASFRDRGQRQPIEIVRRGDGYRLVYGAHRYRAAQIAEWSDIKAVITEADDAELRLREIDENLIRYELTALDRARFLLERKRIYEALNPAATEERARLIEFGVAWSEMSKAERAQVLQHIASDLPKGWTVEKAQ